MNTFQLLRQIRYLLRSRKWTGTANVVFHPDSVVVAAGPEVTLLQARLIPPLAIVRPGASVSDPQYNEEPDYLQFSFDVTIACVISGDRTSQNPIMGAARPNWTTSQGRGILEIEEEVFNAIEMLNTLEGVVIQSVATGAAMAERYEEAGGIVWRDYSFQAYITADRYYHPPRRLSATGGVGSITLTWQLPPDRYDRYRVRLVRKAGATPPASLTDGTELTLTGALVTTHYDVVAAGTYSYSLFASYDETNDPPSADGRTSDPATYAGAVSS